MMMSLIMILLPIALDYASKELEEDEVERPNNYWLYNGTIMGFNFIFYFINQTFLAMSYTDANRRNYMMQKLSQSLEFDFHSKDIISVRMLTINFLDTQSLLSWLK